MQENMLFSGEIYTAGKIFTLPLAVTALTNFTSVYLRSAAFCSISSGEASRKCVCHYTGWTSIVEKKSLWNDRMEVVKFSNGQRDYPRCWHNALCSFTKSHTKWSRVIYCYSNWQKFRFLNFRRSCLFCNRPITGILPNVGRVPGGAHMWDRDLEGEKVFLLKYTSE